jgi:hypothetical protein
MLTQRQFLVGVGVVLLLGVLLTPLTTYAARQREQAQAAAAVLAGPHGPPERQAHAEAARALAANCLQRAQADDPSDLIGTVPCGAARVPAGAFAPWPVYDATAALREAVPDPYGQGR